MQKKKIQVLLAAALCGSMLLSGCSFGNVVDNVVDTVDDVTSEDTDETAEKVVDGKEVDDSLESPTFTREPSGSINIMYGTPYTMTAEATVSDGGTVSYQWYKNNINSNGGGTMIDSASSQELSVETAEEGTVFYYVVATNNKGDGVRKTTSTTEGITVMKPGSWQDDGTGVYHYIYDDNSGYMASTLVYDGTGFMYIDESGQKTAGIWTPDGNYIGDDGYMLTNGWTPDMYYVDENGNKLADCWTPDDHYVNGEGQMWTNGTTPDGVYVDENGNRADPPQ